MAFVMKTRTSWKDSGENSEIRMMLTAKPSTFWVTPKAKPFHVWKPVWASCKRTPYVWTLDSFFFPLVVKNRNEKPIKHVSWHFLVLFWMKDLPRCENWTLDFEPTFLSGFSPFWARDLIFTTGQRFPTTKHVTFTFPVTFGSGDVSGDFGTHLFGIS